MPSFNYNNGIKINQVSELLNIIRCCFICFVLGVAGCAEVQVNAVGANDYIALRRGDILTTGQLSSFTKSSLQVFGIDSGGCTFPDSICRSTLSQTRALNNEQRLSALSELWLQEALLFSRQDALNSPERRARALNAYIESAKYAYAYLFLTERTPQMRAMEDRQTQVRDYYNFSTQQMVTQLFARYKDQVAQSYDQTGNFVLQFDGWEILGAMDKTQALVKQNPLPTQLIPATELTFNGLQNIYRRDGIGAELVAEMNYPEADLVNPWREIPYPEITVISQFSGKNLDEVLNSRQVTLTGFNPFRRNDIDIHQITMPLAANFTSSYGIWLARSQFAKQALFTLFGVGDVLKKARIYMMQPYDPNRRIIIMLHGLASSPETWVNMANEILGDETLRQHYQIWQVYYPTNLPLMVNLYEIRQAIQATLDNVDPEHNAPATKNMVLIGHSMGGVLARLLISSSGDVVWNALKTELSLKQQTQQKVKDQLVKYVDFTPLPGITSAIFLATPHRGTPFAENFIGRTVAKLVSLPVTLVKTVNEIATLIAEPNEDSRDAARSVTSINSLSDHDMFIKATAELPVSDQVSYYSIIGDDAPDLPITASSDGVVPYSSSHLNGAVSEKVIPSWHDVQQRPEAIVEIRRILHERMLK